MSGIQQSVFVLHTKEENHEEITTFALTSEEAKLLFETLQNKRKEIIDAHIDNMLT